MDRYRCLQAFIAAADARSITRASRALSVSKSAVSERLVQLEGLVGQSLLARTTRSVVLTEAGEKLYGDVRASTLVLADLENAFKRPASSLTGKIRITASIDIGIEDIAEALSELRVGNPELTFDIAFSNDVVDPRSGGFDLAFHYRRLRRPGLAQSMIGTLDCALFTSPSYLAGAEEPREPRQLCDHICLGYGFQGAVENWNVRAWNFVNPTSGEHARVIVSLGVQAGSSHVLIRFACDGHGIVILPEIRAARYVREGLLVPVLAAWKPPILQLFASFPREHAKTRRVQLVVEAVRTNLAEKAGAPL